MTDPNANSRNADNEGLEPEEGAAAPESTTEVAASPEAESARLKDQLLRALAEAENTRRRMQKEIEDTRKYAVADFAREMLVVADNFRRALEAVPKEAPKADTLATLVMGVEATERQLLAALEKFGIRRIEPKGQPFDPHFHRVMMEVDDPTHPPGTVVRVLQPGYMIGDRLLREALVAVAKSNEPKAHRVDTSA